jgi:hypothetical protein
VPVSSDLKFPVEGTPEFEPLPGFADGLFCEFSNLFLVSFLDKTLDFIVNVHDLSHLVRETMLS